jgi:hypothetical protein
MSVHATIAAVSSGYGSMVLVENIKDFPMPELEL